jgi:GWxTD domain-containing protein
LKRILLTTIGALGLWAYCLYAQEVQPKVPLVINVEISRFRFQSDKNYLELYYAVSPSNVTLVKMLDTLRGSVILRTRIVNTQNDSLIVHSLVSIPIMIVDTASLGTSSVGKSIYVLPFGSYELIMQGHDTQNPSRQDSIRKRFSIDRYSGLPTMSDIDLCYRIVQSQEKTNPFYKNSYEVIPNPSLFFGGQSAPVVFSYAELYDLNPDSTYSVIVGLMDGKGAFVKQKKRVHRYAARNVVDVNSLNVYAVQSGKYRFVLVLADTLGREIARSEKPIYVYNPHVHADTTIAISAKSAEISGLSDDELIDEFHKAKYIANDESIKMFEKKITTPIGRREFLAKFWSDVESGKFGRNDITRAIYLERILIANQRYRSMGMDGWCSDRGRVYILYAEPDEIERFPSSENAKPYEIWHYYQIESGVQFIFVDRSGFGNYTLVHSTKRGELQDEGWERNLR